MVKGKISNLIETASVEWRIKHCYSLNLEEDIKKWTYETHAGLLTCGKCEKETYITGFNLKEEKVKCCLCGEINDIEIIKELTS
jgi:hypothetical protein